jgi:DNA-binding HxlR family transcriptional regulator
MSDPHRSGCPINLSLELLGDRWSLIVLRDIIFGEKRHFTDLLRRSEEGISPNILTERLDRLEAAGLLTRRPDPRHKQRTILSLTEMAVALVPVLAQLSTWGLRYLPVTPAFAARARVLEAGGPELWARLMQELRHEHLGLPASGTGPSAREVLKAAVRDTTART